MTLGMYFGILGSSAVCLSVPELVVVVGFVVLWFYFIYLYIFPLEVLLIRNRENKLGISSGCTFTGRMHDDQIVCGFFVNIRNTLLVLSTPLVLMITQCWLPWDD